MTQRISLTDAYAHCLHIARGHYENFPVASLAAPRHLRPRIAAVYAFARYADDLADEGDRMPEERLSLLGDWRSQLHRCLEGDAKDPVFIALADTIQRHSIPIGLFDLLIDAFVQDTVTTSYESFHELIEYCSKSANPVGRIVLALNGRLDDHTAPLSDELCTGLQLVNFWQDISVDRLKPRIYIPREDLQHFGVGIDEIFEGSDSDRVRKCIEFQVERTRGFFLRSIPLFELMPFRLRTELRAIWSGGYSILEKIKKQQYTTLQSRPALSISDYFVMVFHALLKGPSHA